MFLKKHQKLISALKLIKTSGAKKLELNDPQFKAIKKLSLFYTPKQLLILSIANSFVCFQLSGKGEDYWKEFSDYFSSKPKDLSFFKDFLFSSKANKRLLNLKLKRISKFSNFSNTLSFSSQLDLWKKLSKNMVTPLNSKTLVFAIKIYGYILRVLKKPFLHYDYSIPIPFDSRISKITNKILGKQVSKKEAIDFWFSISKKTNIPSLHLDSIFWLNPRFINTSKKRIK